MNKRIEWIDVAKAILIFLVMLGHSPIPKWECNAINSFHMAAFFSLSGFTFSYKGNFKEFILKKTRGILLPYIEFSVILLIFFFLKYRFIHSGNFDIIEGIKSIVIPISGRQTASVYGLWFLPCLFLAETVIALCMYLCDRLNKYIGYITGVVVLLICCLLYAYNHVASIISVLPIAIFFSLFGFIIKSKIITASHSSSIIYVLSVFALIICIWLNTVKFANDVDMSSMCLGFIPLYICCGIVGSLSTICVSQYLTKIPYIQMVGRDSLYVYGLHYVIISLVDKVLLGVECAIVTLLLTLPLVMLFKKFRSLSKYL